MSATPAARPQRSEALLLFKHKNANWEGHQPVKNDLIKIRIN